jgi:hypothetical protein
MKILGRYGLIIFLALALCSLLIGCGGSSTSENAPPKTDKKSTETKSPETTTASTSGDKIGVPECDDFLEKYEACINNKVPEATRATFKSSIETWRKSWKEAASTPQGKAGLEAACKTAKESAKQSMGAYGCSW